MFFSESVINTSTHGIVEMTHALKPACIVKCLALVIKKGIFGSRIKNIPTFHNINSMLRFKLIYISFQKYFCKPNYWTQTAKINTISRIQCMHCGSRFLGLIYSFACCSFLLSAPMTPMQCCGWDAGMLQRKVSAVQPRGAETPASAVFPLHAATFCRERRDDPKGNISLWIQYVLLAFMTVDVAPASPLHATVYSVYESPTADQAYWCDLYSLSGKVFFYSPPNPVRRENWVKVKVKNIIIFKMKMKTEAI